MVKPLATILVVLTLFMGPAAFAQPVSYPEPTDPLPEQVDKTYADLIQFIAPGISFDGHSYSGGQLLDMRHIDGWDDDGVMLPASGRLQIAALPAGSRLALLLDFGTAAHHVTDLAILALFDLADTPRLLDAVNASLDRSTSFLEPYFVAFGDSAGLLLTQSTHHNSGQGYANTALTLIQNDRLELIDVISTFRENNCAYERNQSLDVQPAAVAGFADIVATVVEETTIPTETCSSPEAPAPGSREITVTYRWDPGTERYAPDSDAFGMLARENETRF